MRPDGFRSAGRALAEPHRLGLALVCALALAANVPALDNGFPMDDRMIVLQNDRIHNLDSVKDAVLMPYWPTAVGRMALYRPLTSTALALQWDLWHDNPVGYHAVNLALHVAATALLYLLLSLIVGGTAGPLAGSAVWAVHPVHVEAVAGIVGQAEILAAVLVLAGALVYLRKGAGAGTAAVIGVLYLLALGAKEMAATLPGLLVLLELVRGEARGGGGPVRLRRLISEGFGRVLERWRTYVALTVALSTYTALRVTALGTALGAGVAPFFERLSYGEQLLTAVSLWPHYLRLLIFPVDLAADYSPDVITVVTRVADPRVLLGVLVFAVAVTVVWRSWSRSRAVALGVFWFALAVLPVSNLVVPIVVLLAERTLYLPSIGLAVSAAGFVGWAWSRRPAWKPLVSGVLALAVVLGGYRTWIRTPEWKDSDTIINALIRDHPESFRSQWVVAARLFSVGRTDEALALYRSALEAYPGHYELHLEYGRAALRAGEYSEAAESFTAAVAAIPEHPEPHVFRLVALLRDGRPEDAVDAARNALRYHPRNGGIYHQGAIALARTGDFQAALEYRRTSLELAGERAAPEQFVHEAELLVRLNRPDEAAAALERAHEQAAAMAGSTPPGIPTLVELRHAVETADTAVIPYP